MPYKSSSTFIVLPKISSFYFPFFIITILVLLYSKGEELQCQMQLIDQSICLKQSINQTLLLYRDQLYPYHFISGLSPFSLSHPFKVEPPPATECQPQFQFKSVYKTIFLYISLE